jgi:hypothetical protein
MCVQILLPLAYANLSHARRKTANGAEVRTKNTDNNISQQFLVFVLMDDSFALF